MNKNNIRYEKLLEIIELQTEVVQQGLDLSSIMNIVVERSQIITNSDGACIELVEKNELVYSAVSGLAERFLGLRLYKEHSLSGECINIGKILISNDIEKDNRVNKVACRQVGLRSMIVVPLSFKEDIVGVLKVLSSNTDHYDDEVVRILELVSELIGAAMFSALKNEESEIIHKATHDFLTGIPNRSLFYDRLRQSLSHAQNKDEKFGIIILDMDGLKETNDNYGHRAGDAAIKEIALRIKNTLRESDTVARLGGDEFGVIAANTIDCNSISMLIERIYNEISKPFVFEDIKIELKASAGYSIYGEDGNELDHLIEKADKSMYESKRIRKGLGNVRNLSFNEKELNEDVTNLSLC